MHIRLDELAITVIDLLKQFIIIDPLSNTATAEHTSGNRE